MGSSSYFPFLWDFIFCLAFVAVVVVVVVAVAATPHFLCAYFIISACFISFALAAVTATKRRETF